ncbi:MAG: hypothetical protein K2P76_05165 [Lachnospiraceae bacterium]|nr:hypothetical protein [Lachnospiraceae bacterium]MDE6981363.1 hypothetical protein [Lachnospiraceae bacterium]
MNRNIRLFLAVVVYAIGLLASIYIGGWVMIIKPVKGAIAAHALGTLTFYQLVVTVVKCFCSTTVAGFIWVLGYIASNHVFDIRDEQ